MCRRINLLAHIHPCSNCSLSSASHRVQLVKRAMSAFSGQANPKTSRYPHAVMSSSTPSPSSNSTAPSPPRGWFARFLAAVEWLGNLLPHPVTLFALFALGVIVISAIAAAAGLAVDDPRPPGAASRAFDGVIRAKSLLSGDGIRFIATSLVTNFSGFPPLGTVLVALLGVGVAEKSGLLGAAIRGMVLAAPKNAVTMVVVFAGVMSNTASEMGYVVLIPLAATVFHALGRHPFAGLAAAFAGVSGGYSANLLIGTVDPLLAGITEKAAQYVDPAYEVHPAVNWYFMFVSTFLITGLGTWVTSRIVEPRLGKYDVNNADETVERKPVLDRLSAVERKGLKRAGLAALAMFLLLVWLAGPHFGSTVRMPTDTDLATAVGWSSAELNAAIENTRQLQAQHGANAVETADFYVPAKDGIGASINSVLFSLPGWGVLRDPRFNSLVPSPFLRSIVAFIFVFFIVPGFVYGRTVGTMKTDRDIIDAMAGAMSSMGLYIVLVFFAAQFIAFFDWTNLGVILAVLGADVIEAMGLDNPLVFVPFILMCAFVNLMLGSASAQWAVTAPIFVPMLMKVGYSPEVIQAAYRIGDSTTNIITPMMSYFGLILAFAVRYDRKLGIGTLVSTMLPYCLFFLVGWTALFYLWVFLLGLPVGPGAPTYYPPAGM